MNTPPNLNHFTCYPVTLTNGAYKPPAGILLRDEFATANVKVTVNPVPRQLCLPAKKTITTKAGVKSYPMVNPDVHLLCYSGDQDSDPQPGICPEPVRQRHDEGWHHEVPVPALDEAAAPVRLCWIERYDAPGHGNQCHRLRPEGHLAVPHDGSLGRQCRGQQHHAHTHPDPDRRELLRSNSTTGKTVCTGNDNSVYEFTGTSLTTTVSSGGSGTISFSGGTCTNCGVVMDSLHNRALIGMSIGGVPGFQFLNLGTNTFGSAFASPAGAISEDPLVDPGRNLLLSAGENGNFEIANVSNPAAPVFYENGDGQRRDRCHCRRLLHRHRAFAGAENSNPSSVFIADVTQATFTAGSPGTWSAPSQNQTLADSTLLPGADRHRGCAGNPHRRHRGRVRRGRDHCAGPADNVRIRHSGDSGLGHVLARPDAG